MIFNLKHYILIKNIHNGNLINMAIYRENRTTRLTLLIDPKKKATFERLCAQEDVTPSQKVRQFIRDYIESSLGKDWYEIDTKK